MLDSQAVHEVWISAIPGHSLTWAGSAEMTQSTAVKQLEMKIR
ncbi:hypothetical protein [Methylicorpusculum oleiharenae]|nr:hypothetical protein [Methylicorpusculum oleiharenae]